MLDSLVADIRASGHRVTHTCYMQSSSAGWRRAAGSCDKALRVVGESEFAQGVAVHAESRWRTAPA